MFSDMICLVTGPLLDRFRIRLHLGFGSISRNPCLQSLCAHHQRLRAQVLCVTFMMTRSTHGANHSNSRLWLPFSHKISLFDSRLFESNNFYPLVDGNRPCPHIMTLGPSLSVYHRLLDYYLFLLLMKRKSHEVIPVIRGVRSQNDVVVLHK